MVTLDKNMVIGANIRRIRVRKKLKITKLCDTLGIDKARLTEIEHGLETITILHVLIFSKAMHCSCSEIMRGGY